MSNLKIFLILGDARSGTTFLSNNIIKKLGVPIIPETNFIKRLLSSKENTFYSKQKVVNFLFEENKFNDLKIDKNELLNNLSNVSSVKIIIEDILKIYYTKNSGKDSIIGIKKGALLYSLDQITNLFPDIKIINLIRDGRGIYHSKKNSIYSQTGKPFLTNPIQAAKIWNEKIEIMLMSKIKHNAIQFKYEEIINNLDFTLVKIRKFLKLDSNKINKFRNKDGYFVSDIYDKDLHSNINLGPDIKNIDKWKNGLSSQEIFCFELFSKKNLLKFNYKLQCIDKSFGNYFYVCICLLSYLFSKIKILLFNFKQ